MRKAEYSLKQLRLAPATLVLLGCAACGPAKAPSRTATAAPATVARQGESSRFGAPSSMVVGKDQTASLSFVDAKFGEILRCNRDVLGVRVRTAFKVAGRWRHGAKLHLLHQGKAFPVSKGGTPAGACRDAYLRSADSDAPDSDVWEFFEVPVQPGNSHVDHSQLTVRARIQDPAHLGWREVDFRLGVSKVEIPPNYSKPPVARSIAVIDDDFFRLTIIQARSCRTSPSEFDVAYEVVLENSTTRPLGIHRISVEDPETGYAYDRRVYSASPHCKSSEWQQTIARNLREPADPGSKRRGWIHVSGVASEATTLVLRAQIGNMIEGRDVRAQVGKIPPSKAFSGPAKEGTGPGPGFKDLGPVSQEPNAYYHSKLKHIVKAHHISEGKYIASVVPIASRLWATGRYQEWTEKRYSPQQMRTKATEFKADDFYANLVVVFGGSMLAKGRQDLTIPKDIAEYVFLEIDGFEPIPATVAKFPLMTLVGPFSPQGEVLLRFSLPKGARQKLESGRGRAKFAVGGLGFKTTLVTYQLPLNALTDDAPPQLQQMFKQAGL